MSLDSISVTQLISAPFIKFVSIAIGLFGGTGTGVGSSILGLHDNSNIIIRLDKYLK
jgi:hypothetical protein